VDTGVTLPADVTSLAAMEDHETPALWLELNDDGPLGPPQEHIGVWWSNANPGRTDLPRRLPDRAWLRLAAVDPGADSTAATYHRGEGWLFVRTARPGQGRSTGGPTRGILLVLISPRTPDGAQDLRDWADLVHIAEIAAADVPGFTMITPYVRADGGDTPMFLHLYELDTDDPEPAFQAMPKYVSARLGAPGTPAFDEWAWHPELVIDLVQTFALAR